LKVWTISYDPPKCWESHQEFWDSQLGNLETKWHLDAAFMDNHIKYYKGDDNFP